jgi:hypothetical protein
MMGWVAGTISDEPDMENDMGCQRNFGIGTINSINLKVTRTLGLRPPENYIRIG